jgi:hypothetical protein
MNPLNLTDQETVGLKAIIACVMELGLLVTVCVCMLYHIPLDSALFIEAAGFVCAVAGIAYTGFRTQRLTDYGYVTKKGQADAQVAEATKAVPSPISVAAPSTVVAAPPPPVPIS